MKAVFTGKEELAAGITTFHFEPERTVRYNAGQFTEIKLPHENTDERGDKRWFTLSSSPTEELLAITTKFVAKGGSSFKRQLAALKPGIELHMAEPMGDFVLPKDRTIPLLFIAGGMGVTPMRSMIKWLVDQNEQRQVQLLHAVNTESDLIFRDLFTRYDLVYQPQVKQPSPTWRGATGILSARQIADLAGNDNRQLVYVSGPETMVEKFAKELPRLGVNKERLVTDYFPGYPEI